MPSVALKETESANIVKEAATYALECAKGNVDEACSELERAAKVDKELYRQLTFNFLSRACREAIQEIVRSDSRPTAWGSVYHEEVKVAPKVLGKGQSAPDPKASSIVVLAELNIKHLLDFHLPIHGNPLLRAATKEQVAEAARWYLSRSRNFIVKGKWLSLVAEKMPENKLAGDVFTEKKLAELKEEAEK